MPRWIEVMLSAPDEPLTPLARYTQVNGLLYLALGVVVYAWPGVMGLVGAGPLEGQEPALYRMLGLAIAIIGWFYVIGARTNRDSFGLATFADRILVPFFALPLVFTGQVDPMLVLPVAILDPILGIGAFVIWKRQVNRSSATRA
jgi:hypothetical protein